MKTELSKEESARLIELGVDAKLASRCIKYSGRVFDKTPQPNYIFTLTDILSILPKEIKDNGVTEDLNIVMNNDRAFVGYPYIHESHGEEPIVAPELIDALYQLLIWCLEQGYVIQKNDKESRH